MRMDREQAVIFRKSGMAYSEIKARMGVPMSTLSDWFRGQKWSNDIATQNAKKARNSSAIRFAVMNTVRNGRISKIYAEARQEALLDFNDLKYHPLFMAGILTYMSHGNRSYGSRVSLSSMDPKVIRIFRLFLERICGIKNIRIQLLLAENHVNEAAAKAYWVENTGLNEAYFIKSTLIRRKTPANKPYFGVCNIMVNSAYLKNKILRWIELLVEDIGEERYEIDDSAGIV